MTAEDPAAIVLSLTPRQMRDTVQQLRDLVKEAVPGIVEKPRPASKTFNFDHHGPLAAISGYQSWASLGLVRGSDVDDPTGLLEGTGKGMRHLKVKRGEPIPREGVIRLLQHAARLNEELGPARGVVRGWGSRRP